MSDVKAFGEKLKALRKKAGLSQRALAEAVGVHFTYISKLENGKAGTTPSLKTIVKIAEALNVDELELVKAADKSHDIYPFLSDPDALNFMQQALGMISTSEGWRDMQKYLEEKSKKGEIE